MTPVKYWYEHPIDRNKAEERRQYYWFWFGNHFCKMSLKRVILRQIYVSKYSSKYQVLDKTHLFFSFFFLNPYESIVFKEIAKIRSKA